MDSKHNTNSTNNNLAKLESRRRALDVRIQRAKKKEAKVRQAEEQRQNFLIGACVRELAEKNPKARAWLSRQLDRYLTTDAQRKTCAAFLFQDAASSDSNHITVNSQNEDGP